ncbi:MAG: ABC transporter ATP-binding protein [Candidatus Brocadiia bacterium]|jgi:ABC-2 type transport system ATP-binding protein
MPALVEIERLFVSYGRTLAVRDISFAVSKGEVFGFIGPNGAGKTTTIKVLATLLRPSGGFARIDGMDVTKEPQKIRRRIGYVPDFFGVYDDLTTSDYLHFFAAAYRVDHGRRMAVVEDVLALTDLTGKKDSPVDALSRGMKQRLGLARILIHDPDLLLLDEPASGLDPRARIEMRELLKELQKMGKTIIISSHILHELSQICTRIGIIEAGRLVAEGSLTDIYRRLDLKRVIHVQIVNLSEAMLQSIRAIPGVASAEPAIDRLSIHIREDVIQVEDLLIRLHQLGARVRMYQPEAMDMETVFMKLTEGKTA